MDYIHNIRKKIGHSAIILVGTNIVVINKHHQILLQKRKDIGTWWVPGGYLELGETIEDCAKRELFEETGLIARNMELIKVFSGNDFICKYPNGDRVQNVICLFEITDVKGKPNNNSDESAELRFFSFTELPAFDGIAKIVFAEYVRKRKAALKRVITSL